MKANVHAGPGASAHGRRIWNARGVSLPEMLVVIAIIGVLAGVAIAVYPSLLGPSKAVVATSTLEALNTGVHAFNQTNYELLVNADAASGRDEMLVLQTLQHRDPVNPAPGSPYAPSHWNPDASSSTSEYRIMWTGSIFRLLAPGTAGTGLKVEFQGGSKEDADGL